MAKTRYWHFSETNKLLRYQDGREIVPGQTTKMILAAKPKTRRKK